MITFRQKVRPTRHRYFRGNAIPLNRNPTAIGYDNRARFFNPRRELANCNLELREARHDDLRQLIKREQVFDPRAPISRPLASKRERD